MGNAGPVGNQGPQGPPGPWLLAKTAPGANVITTVDNSANNVGQFTSIAIGTDGLPVMSYQDQTTTFNLWIAHCSVLDCSSSTKVEVDNSANYVGWYTSIAIGADGLPIVSYLDSSTNNLWVAHCSVVDCSSFTKIEVDNSANQVGYFSSIAIGTDGLPIISYSNFTTQNLQVAHCSTVDCSSSTKFVVDNSANNVGWDTSIAIGTDGFPIVSYTDTTTGNLWVAHCSAVDCSSSTRFEVDNSANNVGYYTSIAIGTDGLPVISYGDITTGNLWVAHCSVVDCSSSTKFEVDNSVNNVGLQTSIAIGADGLPVISYQDVTTDNLWVAHCSAADCSSSTKVEVDSSVSQVGEYSSIAIGTDGLPIVSYQDVTAGNLKVLHCSNPLCIPYWRR